MKIIFTIIAALLGGALAQWPGALFGALSGWLVVAYIELRGDVSQLRASVEKLANLVRQGAAREEQSESRWQRRPQPQSQAQSEPEPQPQDIPLPEDLSSVTDSMPAIEAPLPEESLPQARPAAPPIRRVEPSAVERAIEAGIQWVKDYFTGGNTLVRVGVIILFFGVAFLLKYAAEHTHVPIEFRLAGVAVGAIVLLVLGWRLRVKRLGYALALQGAAVGILYLVVFAAFRLYATLPALAAFALLAAIAAFSAVLAILQNSRAMAVLGAIGGFLAPLLASTGQGSHVALFSYYLVLNLGILGIAWFKAWRELNVVGFVFTFVIGTAWGVLKYREELFASTEPFLIVYFLLYVAIGVLYAARQPPQLRGYVDGTMVFGTPIAAFGLQSAMLRHDHYALAVSAAAASALYLSIAFAIFRSRREGYRVLVEAHWALCVVFATLTVPLALDGHWTAATWALEGAAVVWLGCKQNRKLARAFGVFLQLAAGAALFKVIDADFSHNLALSSLWLDAALVGCAGVFIAVLLTRNAERLAQYERGAAPALFFWGLAWWLVAWTTEIHRQLPSMYELHATLAVVAVTAVLCSVLSRRAIAIARLPALWLLPAMAGFALIDVIDVHHPAARYGFAAWPLSFAMFYWIVWQHQSDLKERVASTLHVASLWLLVALASWELAWNIDHAVQGSGSWPAIAWVLVPATMLFVLHGLTQRLSWPTRAHQHAYLVAGGAGLAAFLVVWAVGASLHKGDPYPLPYVPLLNPLDIAQAMALLAVLQWWWRCERIGAHAVVRNTREIFSVLAIAAFIWLNAVLLRTLHYWAGEPFGLDVMLRSMLVQTALSIFWTLLALFTMVFATRKHARLVWFVGATLMGVVVLKLFVIDLSRIGTVERIVSFIAVGILMLVIGYFAPLPPARKEAT